MFEAKKFIKRCVKRLRLIINENKIKYMRVGRNECQIQQTAGLQVGQYMFEEVNNFKYEGTNLSSTSDNHEEIKKHITLGNKCFTSSLGRIHCRKNQKNNYRDIAIPVIIYTHET